MDMIKENERNIIERKYVGWKEHEFNATFTGLFWYSQEWRDS